MGSPPPMRGKAFQTSYFVPPIRITPAYAGKRLFVKLLEINSQDHPRLCGEKSSSFSSSSINLGSPPPMRGKGQFASMSGRYQGITPAYAGKSKHPHSDQRLSQDHPRLCGEKCGVLFLSFTCSGSPPPMRGKGYLLYFFQHFSGITPAYAGKRIDWNFNPVAYKDHPRLCGEKLVYTQSEHLSRGSPPPMRGKVLLLQHHVFSPGITPAYAGKSPTGFLRYHDH